MKEPILNPGKKDWPAIIQRPQMNADQLEKTVSEIIERVKFKGDQAVKDYSLKFHGFSPDNIWVTEVEIARAAEDIEEDLKKSILLARDNIKKFHLSQLEEIKKIETAPGVICWRKSVAINKVGLYIPGGSAPLFSTLLMLAIPAKIAGCENIIVTTPANKLGQVDTSILFVAHILGVTKIYKGGGAQAIAAMAYGTESMDKVDKIFGPGNQYVTYAKKMVNMEGTAIDMLAGPSELAVYADNSCVPEYVAADLLSQAEHGADSQVVLVASTLEIIESVKKAIGHQVDLLPRKEIIQKSLLNARFIVMADRKLAFEFLNQYAPEHLIIASEEADLISGLVKNAGSVFLGNFSPESAGDYASGTNHSLPTNGTATTYSGVSVDSFVKKITFQKLSRDGIVSIGTAVEIMAAAEGLAAHKNAVTLRLKDINK